MQKKWSGCRNMDIISCLFVFIKVFYEIRKKYFLIFQVILLERRFGEFHFPEQDCPLLHCTAHRTFIGSAQSWKALWFYKREKKQPK